MQKKTPTHQHPLSKQRTKLSPYLKILQQGAQRISHSLQIIFSDNYRQIIIRRLDSSSEK
ncbi:MAG: hypothetical protein ACJAYG_001953 [Oceanicoccus sp.]|jgi:hypothetical protein